ncbi:hypothetical protein GGX14DRAFT_357929 [Mycena pura]|uniref:FAD-binding PCMH-type domain-containing protein n=1 Tax=Mycena pura TaxID=153505 RepID=A0AAD6YJ36_9AGAR|nr:hypothetical protein GGX14DRAFT_357929 [Mycena pura]
MDALVAALQADGIPVHKIGEEAYERSVATSNLLYRFSRPGCVVQPERDSHVRSIIQEAKSRGIPVIIKNGGHSYAGSSTAKSGNSISLDLSRMNKVALDLAAETVTLQGGALWGHAYKALVNHISANGRRHLDGYLINGGRCPTVGVSGFILGGGLGPFTRRFGMGCDALTEATLVVADGRIVTVKDTDARNSSHGKLFWALRGAGGGNFGVVVEMKLKLQRLSNPEGLVVSSQYTWLPKPDFTAMQQFRQAMNDIYIANWPDEMTIDSTWRCEPSRVGSEFGVQFFVHYDGNKASFERLIEGSIHNQHLAQQLKRRSVEEPSSLYLHESLVTQWSEETIRAFPINPSYRIYSSFVFKNDRNTIVNAIFPIVQAMEDFRGRFATEQVLLEVTWIHSGGQASRNDERDTAFRWRGGVYYVYIMVQWQAKWLGDEMRGVLRTLQQLRPYSLYKRAAFINFPDATLDQEDLPPGTRPEDVYERAYYGDNYKELRKVKRLWDKDDFFRWDQAVKQPAAQQQPQQQRDAPVQRDDEDGDDDHVSVDALARQQWNSYMPPPAQEALHLDLVGGGRLLHGLTDLGF